MSSTPPPRDAGEQPALSAALEATIERFQRMIVAIGRRHGLPESDVDEVVQEVRIRLWHARGEPAALEELGSSYVHKVAVSAALDMLRRRRYARTGVEAVIELPQTLASGSSGPAGDVISHDLEEQVFLAVDRLPDARRAVVRMYLAGYHRGEIGAALGWNEVRVRNLLHRGLTELRSILRAAGITPLEAGE
jgi:RNA polymerase sigma-70 factor (ECF subfamily)